MRWYNFETLKSYVPRIFRFWVYQNCTDVQCSEILTVRPDKPLCYIIHAKMKLIFQYKRNWKKDGFKCADCDKTFSCYSHLKRHEIMHTDDKPFNCEFCQKEFRRKYDRNRHVKFVHLKPLAKLQEENGLSAENLFSLTDAAASVNQKAPIGNSGLNDR